MTKIIDHPNLERDNSVPGVILNKDSQGLRAYKASAKARANTAKQISHLKATVDKLLTVLGGSV